MKFVEEMRELLDRITQARTDWDKQEAEREMADLIRKHAGGRREPMPRDSKMLQAGDGD